MSNWTNILNTDIPKDKATRMRRRIEDKSTLFIEKYRPLYIDEFIGQEHLMESFQDMIEKGKKNNNFSDLILTGPKGVGKSSFAKIIPREVLGPKWKLNFLEVNVPNKKNDVNFIQGEFTSFITKAPKDGAAFRFVFLDECEALDSQAMKSLKKFVDDKEKYSYVRYILATNYSESHLDLLTGGRFIVLHFKKVSNEIAKAYLKYICALEGIHSDIFVKEGLNGEDDITLNLIIDLIVEEADGCLREGLSLLDDLRNVHNYISLKKLKNRLAYSKPDNVTELLEKAIHNKDYIKYFNENILTQNITMTKLVDKIANEIDKLKIDQKEKRYMFECLGECSFRMDNCTNHILQMRCLLHSFAGIHDI